MRSLRSAGAWTDLPPDVLNVKTGGVLKTIGTAGIVKGDIIGNLQGDRSRTQISQPVEILVYTPEGTAIIEISFRSRVRRQRLAHMRSCCRLSVPASMKF